jgi:hypothetical protein
MRSRKGQKAEKLEAMATLVAASHLVASSVADKYIVKMTDVAQKSTKLLTRIRMFCVALVSGDDLRDQDL